MSTWILLGVAFVLLVAGWFSWIREGVGASLVRWRKLLAWAGVLALSAAVLGFVGFLMLVRHLELARVQLATAQSIVSVVRFGFWTAAVAVFASWFANRRSRVYLATASLIIWFLWLAQAAGA